jgi:lambda family phage portal protein
MANAKQKVVATVRKSRAAKAASEVLPTLLAAPSGLSAVKADFTTGSDGRMQRVSWGQREQSPWAMTGGGYYSFQTGGYVNRERNLAQSVARDFATANSTIATLLVNLTTQAVGANGLTLSAKLDAAALGITPDAARDLGSRIEAAWRRWSNSPTECDLSGRFDIHQLAGAGFEYWLITGELAALIDWRAIRGATTRTKISLIDPNQIDTTKSISGPGPGDATLNGVVFDAQGTLKGYWIRPLKTGHYNQAPVPVFIAARTSFSRQRIIHLFEHRVPGQVRGLSPLVAALTPANEKGMLGEYTQAANLLQTQYALTVTSSLPPAAAARGLQTQSDNGLGHEGLAEQAFDSLGARAGFYEGMPISAKPGVINFMSPGDKLEMHRAQSPNDTFESFDQSLARTAAKAAGASYEDLSGDYSKTSFSASRMAVHLPHKITLRRRRTIVEGFYKAAYAAWLEEVVNTGEIELPKNCKPFWAAREAFLESRWLGDGAVQADPYKAALTTEKELELGLTTLADALAERGLALDTVIAERKAEREMLREAGLLPDLKALTNANGAQTIEGELAAEQAEADQAESLPVLPNRKRKA